jgi:NTE family protein
MGDRMYLVESGRVVVWDENADEALAYLGPGSFVGEMALLLAQPRTASLRVVLDADLYTLKKHDFSAILETNPAIAVQMTRELSKRLHATSQKKFKVQPRRISVLWGNGGNQLARALTKLLKETVGLLDLSGSPRDTEATLIGGVLSLAGEAISEETLAERLALAIEKHSHILIVLPREANAVARKAVNLADTVISVGQPPHWLQQSVSSPKLWQTNTDLKGLDRIARRLAGRTVGLALSSGGSRGAAHIGVMKILRQEGIPIDLMTGSSAGAIFGSFFAAGFGDAEMEEIPDLIRQFFRRLFNYDLNLPPRSGIGRGIRARHFINRLLEERNFEDLKIPFYCVAADIMTGEERVFGPGDDVTLADAVRASVSIPILGDPWQINGRYLIDGAIVNPLPAKLLREKGADIVIASSVIQPVRKGQPEVALKQKMPHFLTIVSNMLGSMEAELVKHQQEFIDVTIHTRAETSHVLDFDHTRDLIRAGEEAAREQLPKIRAVLEGGRVEGDRN